LRLIVGLGNPGRKYQGTRHNVGFMVIDALARRHGIHVRARRSKALVGEGAVAGEQVILAKPLTFMNLSGEAVGGLVRRYRLAASDLVVVCDDVNLPLGRLRVRAKGSAGGHKGLKSIIRALGTEEFARVRIGIGSPAGDMVDYVLSRFKRVEAPEARRMVTRGTDAVEAILTCGIEEAMNEFNAPTEQG
jgi:PTH1 family peptidyl-tRNA hydrolase